MGYKLDEIEGIGPTYRSKLEAAGIDNTDELLEKCGSSAGRKAIATETGISSGILLKWVAMADLMRISGIGGQFGELLKASGVDTIKELRVRRADNLASKLEAVNDDKRLARSTPSQSQVQRWIEAAKSMEPIITH